MTWRAFQAKYLGSALGSVWAVLNPLALIFIYIVVFSQVMGAKLDLVDDTMGYGVFLCAGLIPWTMFVETLQRSVVVFVEQGNLLKKMSFPRATLPVIVLLSAMVDFVIMAGLLGVVLLVVGRWPGSAVLAFLPLLALQQLLALGLGIALGVLNVFFRDVGQAVGIAVQFWFWFTPIVYPMSVVPEWVHPVLALNPMNAIVRAYQDILLFGRAPDWSGFVPHVVLALCVLGFSRSVFRRLSGEMTDHL